MELDMEAELNRQALKIYGRSMADISDETEAMVVCAERFAHLSRIAATAEEYQMALHMRQVMQSAALNLADPERGQMGRFARAMMGRA